MQRIDTPQFLIMRRSASFSCFSCWISFYLVSSSFKSPKITFFMLPAERWHLFLSNFLMIEKILVCNDFKLARAGVLSKLLVAELLSKLTSPLNS